MTYLSFHKHEFPVNINEWIVTAVSQTVVICKIQLHKWEFINRIKKSFLHFSFLMGNDHFLNADIPTNISLARIKYQNRVNVELTPEK